MTRKRLIRRKTNQPTNQPTWLFREKESRMSRKTISTRHLQRAS